MTDSERFIVVDLGGTHVRVALAVGNSLAERTVGNTDHRQGPSGVIRQIVRLSRDVLGAHEAHSRDIARVVVAAPGPLEPGTGIVFDAPNMPGWHRVPLAEELSRALDIDVAVINDANAAALGEHSFGAGRGQRNLVYLTVSTGIGGGVIVENRLLEGASGAAGEIGHMVIDRYGPPCGCGYRGCLESLASGTAIARSFRRRLSEGRQSVVTGWTAVPTAADVSRGAVLGDPLACEVLDDAMDALSVGVINCVNIFNPDVVVIGGGVTEVGDLMFARVRQAVSDGALAVPARATGVVPAQLGDNAGLFGALAYGRVLDRLEAPAPGHTSL